MTIYNEDLRPESNDLFKNKLAVALEDLKEKYTKGELQTVEELSNEFSKAIRKFYRDPHTPFFEPVHAVFGTPPSYEDHNDNFGDINRDLTVGFNQLEALEDLLIKNFNFAVSERDKINKLVKKIGSLVGDYVLYSDDPIGNALYVKDSFNDTSKTDLGSNLLTEKQCEILQSEGIVSLPVVRTGAPQSRVPNIKINDSSNGSAGNYQEIGAASHDDIDAILDANPDTWFEYENVVSEITGDTQALRLDLTLYFDAPTIINFIRLNPNNFGTQNPVKILTIDTSYRGNIWTSIKDDIPIADFLGEDEENVFTLASSTSKFAGQGLYTFTPRKVKYVHIVLEQNTPYQIQTSSGYAWRYAIGIRDIHLQALEYEEKGDFISLPFNFAQEVQKVSILASENPVEVSELADVAHQVSPDDGATWYDIQPQERSGLEVPEILNFNNAAIDAIQTDSPVFALRHRMLLERFPNAFKAGASTLRQEIRSGNDLLGIPTFSPLELELTRSPVAGTVTLMNPLWGMRSFATGTDDVVSGKVAAAKHVIGRSTGVNGMRFALPDVVSEYLIDGSLDIDDIVVWVDDETGWSRVGDWSNGSVDTDTKHYTLSRDGILQFGNGDFTSALGRIPAAGSYIGFTLREEQLQFNSSFTCELLFPTDGDQENVKIWRIDQVKEDNTVDLKPGATVHRLPHQNIDDGTLGDDVAISPDTNFDDYKTYIDGSQELVNDGDYSIDYENGIIYSYTPVANTGTVTVTYDYQPKVRIGNTNWEFVHGADRTYRKIKISPDVFSDIPYTGQSITASVRVVDFGVTNITPKSMVFSTPSSLFDSGADPYEVAYVDGVTEFKKEDTEIDFSGYYSIDYKNGIMYVSPDDTTGGTPGTVDFRAMNFQAEYNIARIVDGNEFTVNTETKLVSVSHREAMRVWGKTAIERKQDVLLKAVYDYVYSSRESIEELEPYFSPIVRDVVLKVIPKGLTS